MRKWSYFLLIQPKIMQWKQQECTYTDPRKYEATQYIPEITDDEFDISRNFKKNLEWILEGLT